MYRPHGFWRCEGNHQTFTGLPPVAALARGGAVPEHTPAGVATLAAAAGAGHLGGPPNPGVGVMEVRTRAYALVDPLHGSWRNRAESVQRILKRRALAGQHPQTPEEIIGLLEATGRGWNQAPTPFVWGGKRALRRARSRRRQHRLGGSGACVLRPLRRFPTLVQQWRQKCQMTH